MNRRRIALIVLVSASMVLLGACRSNKKSQTPVSGKATTTTTTTMAATGTTAIPVSVVGTGTGGFRVLVDASVAGGPTVPMWLDTGSAGMLVDPSVIGSQASTGNGSVNYQYLGFGISGSVVNAPVTIGSAKTSVTTSGAINVGSITGVTCATGPCSTSRLFGAGVYGIIGIAPGQGAQLSAPLFSPLLQVASPAQTGWTIALPGAGLGSGTLTFGPVSPAAGATAIALSPIGNYPNGMPGFAKDVNLCWTIGTGSACGATNLDIGAPKTLVTPGLIPGVPATNGVVNTGTAVKVAAPNGGGTIWSFKAGVSPSRNLVELTSALGGATQYNTGIAVFLGQNIAWSVANAKLYVWG